MIKIISGTLKNRNILLSKSFIHNQKIRPTSNYIKQLLLNLIHNNFEIKSRMSLKDIIVADICCGTGAVGFEFLSNGAKKCYFIDNNIEILKNIKKTASSMNVSNKIETSDKIGYLRALDDKIDLIFIDPPYQDQDRILNNFISLAGKCKSTKNALFIAETKGDFSENLIKNNCEIILNKSGISDTWLCFFKIIKKEVVIENGG